jgi:hypothetical protein
LPELELEKTEIGSSFLGSFDSLNLTAKVDAVITSPPFAESTRFYIANWMRLWMAGWEPEHFKGNKDQFLEQRQKESFDAYIPFFNKCAQWLKQDGILIMHTGKTTKSNMAENIINRMTSDFELIHHFNEDVAGREKFGIRDQGATTSHQYIFFQKKTNS